MQVNEMQTKRMISVGEFKVYVRGAEVKINVGIKMDVLLFYYVWFGARI